MAVRLLIWGGLALVALSLAGFGAWIMRLPATPASGLALPVAQDEMDAMLAALRPPKRARPLIAIIGINDATETTDYLMPTGILRRADIADVVTLATQPGPVRLYPALTVEPDATIADFDARHPEGADYVIVPAMSRDDDPAALAWIQSQAGKGAIIVGVCVGAKVVAAAGLLDGRRATTHWYFVPEMLRRNPAIDYVRDRRMVADRGVATTTGITASMPMMLTLIEAIAGRSKAEEVAQGLGIPRWDARHDSDAFRLTRRFAAAVLLNRLAFWTHEELGIRLEPGMDEVSLALVADAWSRTYRSGATTFAASTSAVATANSIRVLPDQATADWPEQRSVSTFPGQRPAAALDRALHAITERYGERTSHIVAMQLEYPRSDQVR